MNNLIFKDAGRAIGGGLLTHVLRDGAIVGHITYLDGMYMVHKDPTNWGAFVITYSRAEAKTHFATFVAPAPLIVPEEVSHNNYLPPRNDIIKAVVGLRDIILSHISQTKRHRKE